MKDDFGDRMKGYEATTRFKLPRRSYTIIRIDGKAFHSYTRGMQRPFDMGFIEDMDNTAIHLCKNIMGAKFAFVQSDEISIVLTDFETIQTQAWFDNNIQKMCSISASMATSEFNNLRLQRRVIETSMAALTLDNIKSQKLANFDSRVYQIPQLTEVFNYFVWRQQDTTRNSIQSVARSVFSHKQVDGKNTNQMQEMLFEEKGINWNDFEPKLKRGRGIVKNTIIKNDVERKVWESVEVPIFTQNREFLSKIIPLNQ